MEHVRFGRTGLRVSRLCLGTMTFGYQCDEPAVGAPSSTRRPRPASPSSTPPTSTRSAAPLSRLGRTEEILGRWLTGRRDRFILATKCFAPTGPSPWDPGISRKHIMRAIDASLRRLHTDHVDLYQLHVWDAHTPIDETLLALDDLVRAGKVRYVGFSNFLAYQLARSLGRSEVLGVGPLRLAAAPLQPALPPDRAGAAAARAEEQIAVIPYNPLAGGLLTGKHAAERRPTEGTRFTLGNAAERYTDRYWHEREFDTVEALRHVADEAGLSMAELAVAWVLANPAITCPIIGASRPDQLDDAPRAPSSTPLEPDLKARLDELTAEYRFGDAAR